MKNELEYLKEGIKDFSIKDLTDVIRIEPLIAGKIPIEIMNDEQKENLRIKLIEIANLVLELSKMEEQYLSELFDDLDIPKDVKKRINSEIINLFLK